MKMTVQEAAERWNVSEVAIRTWIKEGRIKATRLSEILKAQGLPTPKRDSWIIAQEERPSMSTAPIVRESVIVDDDGGLPASEPGSVQGFWRTW